MNIVFIAAHASYRYKKAMDIVLINAKAKSVIVYAIILFSWGIEGDS